MEYTASPKPQLSSRANAFSIAALMSSGKSSKDKDTEENTIKPLGELRPRTLLRIIISLDIATFPDLPVQRRWLLLSLVFKAQLELFENLVSERHFVALQIKLYMVLTI